MDVRPVRKLAAIHESAPRFMEVFESLRRGLFRGTCTREPSADERAAKVSYGSSICIAERKSSVLSPPLSSSLLSSLFLLLFIASNQGKVSRSEKARTPR